MSRLNRIKAHNIASSDETDKLIQLIPPGQLSRVDIVNAKIAKNLKIEMRMKSYGKDGQMHDVEMLYSERRPPRIVENSSNKGSSRIKMKLAIEKSARTEESLTVKEHPRINIIACQNQSPPRHPSPNLGARIGSAQQSNSKNKSNKKQPASTSYMVYIADTLKHQRREDQSHSAVFTSSQYFHSVSPYHDNIVSNYGYMLHSAGGYNSGFIDKCSQVIKRYMQMKFNHTEKYPTSSLLLTTMHTVITHIESFISDQSISNILYAGLHVSIYCVHRDSILTVNVGLCTAIHVHLPCMIDVPLLRQIDNQIANNNYGKNDDDGEEDECMHPDRFHNQVLQILSYNSGSIAFQPSPLQQGRKVPLYDGINRGMGVRTSKGHNGKGNVQRSKTLQILKFTSNLSESSSDSEEPIPDQEHNTNKKPQSKPKRKSSIQTKPAHPYTQVTEDHSINLSTNLPMKLRCDNLLAQGLLRSSPVDSKILEMKISSEDSQYYPIESSRILGYTCTRLAGVTSAMGKDREIMDRQWTG